MKQEKTNAYETIKKWIFDHRIVPGEKISERSLAEALGLSRVPIREAFQRLTLEGFLISIPGKGVHLRQYNGQDICDLYAYREALDGMAARYCALRAEKMEINYLKLKYEEMNSIAENYDSTRWRIVDVEFHTAIAEGSRNSRIIHTVNNVLQECLYLSKIYPSNMPDDPNDPPSHIGKVLEEHRKILDTISSGDEQAAEMATRESVQSGLERLMEAYASVAQNVKSRLA